MKDYHIKNVFVGGVFANGNTKGASIGWEDYEGYFGQISIVSPENIHLAGDNVQIDSENMSPEFIKAVLCRMVDLAYKEQK
jgi:hypothetical protein